MVCTGTSVVTALRCQGAIRTELLHDLLLAGFLGQNIVSLQQPAHIVSSPAHVLFIPACSYPMRISTNHIFNCMTRLCVSSCNSMLEMVTKPMHPLFIGTLCGAAVPQLLADTLVLKMCSQRSSWSSRLLGPILHYPQPRQGGTHK